MERIKISYGTRICELHEAEMSPTSRTNRTQKPRNRFYRRKKLKQMRLDVGVSIYSISYDFGQCGRDQTID